MLGILFIYMSPLRLCVEYAIPTAVWDSQQYFFVPSHPGQVVTSEDICSPYVCSHMNTQAEEFRAIQVFAQRSGQKQTYHHILKVLVSSFQWVTCRETYKMELFSTHKYLLLS
jgi:hypothetical protein